MKKTFLCITALLLIVILVSWGYVGHQAVGIIAENHLTPQAKQAVNELLGNQSLGDVASWADEIRDDKTFPEHFINSPLGLSRQQFEDEVKNQPQDNVFKAIVANEDVLKSTNTSKEDKEKALKFIVHFVGDLHQPFHVSRKEDKGGNTIQVRFNDQGTNMHSVWDSKLIDKQGLSSLEIVKQFDKATPQEIKQWQSDGLMQWIWESYQISTKLYTEVKPGNKLCDEYYQSHISLVDERIEKAGIRLAGLLNSLFSNVRLANESSKESDLSEKPANNATKDIIRTINAKDAAKYIGMTVSTTAKVYSTRDMGSFVLVNLGAKYPNQLITVVLRGEAKSFDKELNGRAITVTGKITEFKGKPQIEVRSQNEIKVELTDNMVGSSFN